MTDAETARNEKELLDKKKLAEILGIDLEALESLPEEPEVHYSVGIIGTAGHVDHGKSTLTQALTGKFPATHSEELLRGITIKLGYSHLDILYCPNKKLPEALTSNANPKCNGEKPRHLRCYSILDHPGHEILVPTMLSGASIIDYAIVVIAANEPCPMPQTREHVVALETMGVKDIIVVQNKIELVSKEKLFEHYKQIIKFFSEETSYGIPPIIPASAALGINIDLVLAAILQYFKPKERKTTGSPLMYIARTFDPNLPGSDPTKLVGGAVGGALKQGELKVGDEIEIRPGKVEKDGSYQVIFSKVASIRTDGGHNLEKAYPHTLIGVATYLDPGLTKADGLAGTVLGKPNQLPPIVKKIYVKKIKMLPKIVGAKVHIDNFPLRKGEVLLVNVGTNINMGLVTHVQDDEAEIVLKKPISFPKGEIVALSRRIQREFRLVGHGILDY